MEHQLREQRVTIGLISRTVENFKKVGQKNFTAAIIRNRQQILKEHWSRCQRLHVNIDAGATPEDREKEPYFVDDEFLTAEEVYMAASDFLSEALEKFTKPVANSTSINDSSITTENNSTMIQLPRILLPRFSGRYTDWANFRDIFESLVANNESLSNVQRLHYLKSSLIDEASLVIKNITVTDANYRTAWSELKSRYENQRAIIASYLQTIFNISPMKSESVAALKLVRDTTNDALSALRNLGRPVDTWDDLLVFNTVQNLDPRTRKEWELSLGDSVEQPTYKDLNSFLSTRIRALEAANSSIDNSSTKFNRSAGTKSHVSAVSTSKCLSCQSSHALSQCTQFKSLSSEQRRAFAKQQHCCFNCLRTGHFPRDCPSQGRCTRCKRRHHTLLHYESDVEDNATKVTTPTKSPASGNSVSDTTSTNLSLKVHTAGRQGNKCSILLATARVLVRTPNGRSCRIRALIDPGSEATFITERVAQLLKAKRQKTHVKVSGLGGQSTGTANYTVYLNLSSCNGNGPSIPVNALVFSTLTSYCPAQSICSQEYPHLQGLHLADTDPSSRESIGMLIGADLYGSILLDGLRRGPSDTPVAQHTIFGWILLGPVSENQSASHVSTLHCSVLPDVDDSLKRFWEIEEPPKASTTLSEEERLCEKHFSSTHSRLPNGRYMVRLPFKGISVDLGDSFQTASKCWDRLERRLARNPKLHEAYSEFLREYEDLGHMNPILPHETAPGSSFYIPHHPVFKESTTSPLRVVFNASSPTTNGTSLNDHLMIGPKLQRNLPSIIMRWRKHRLVFIADIAKMFRQILVHPADTDYQRILWRPHPDLPLLIYRLLTVTYGTAAAPYLAMRVLLQLCIDEGSLYPLAVVVLEEDTYVDDALFGADDVSTILEMRRQLILLLKLGGFHLRKWATNYDELLTEIPVSDCVNLDQLPLEEEPSMKVLASHLRNGD
ncbi:uncharacterized protein [Temnothorax nylanderi]|uniref:uncharacterized protein n=1 Tax=Temnothorax nylanderi TaxID=102681 RepID=UPI003A88BC1E